MALLAFLLAAPVFGQTAQRDMIVSTGWLATHLDGQVVVIEIGEKADYDAAHIPGARLLQRKDLLATVGNIPDELPPVDELEATFTKLGVGSTKRIVLYSRNPLFATRAWFTFDYLGQGARTSVLDGGIARWTAEGRPTANTPSSYDADTFTAKPNLAVILRLGSMKTLVCTRGTLKSSLVMLDARPEVDYDGQYSVAGVARAGHIPGAINVPWRRNLAGENGEALFRSEQELRALYSNVRVSRDTTVVAYCSTGVEASMTYFVLRYLGFSPMLYDGSFVQWSCDDETPVV